MSRCSRGDIFCPSCEYLPTRCETTCAYLPDFLDHHVIAYVQSAETGRVYELDGAKKAPQAKNVQLLADEDLMSPKVLRKIREDCVERYGEPIQGPCSMMGLVLPYFGNDPRMLAAPYSDGYSVI